MFPWIPATTVACLLALAFLRRRFGPLVGYVLGLFAPVAMLSLVGLVLVVGWFAIGSLTAYADSLHNRSFAAGLWRAHAGDRTRAHMVDDLVRNRRLDGLTRTQIQSLLGPSNNDQYGSPKDALVYWLGADRGWLDITFREQLVSEVEIRPYDD
jgi:hypothetical protein